MPVLARCIAAAVEGSICCMVTTASGAARTVERMMCGECSAFALSSEKMHSMVKNADGQPGERESDLHLHGTRFVPGSRFLPAVTSVNLDTSGAYHCQPRQL